MLHSMAHPSEERSPRTGPFEEAVDLRIAEESLPGGITDDGEAVAVSLNIPVREAGVREEAGSELKTPGFGDLDPGDVRDRDPGFGSERPTFARGTGPEDCPGPSLVALLAAVKRDLDVGTVVGAPQNVGVGLGNDRATAGDGRGGGEGGDAGAAEVAGGGVPSRVGGAGDDLGSGPPVMSG